MTRRHLRPTAAFLMTLLALAAGLSSCTRRIGWGVVLWSSAEGPLPAGSAVPVYIKSNIQKLYVVGVPGSDKKVELPLWQVELFPSKAKARARIAQFGPNQHLYMVAARDGLPLREEPTNNAKRVYRLREGESVKVLAKAKGEAVTTGGDALPGEWYQVLSEGGAVGYVFSYAMRIYDETKEGPPSLAVDSKAVSGQIELVFSRSWKPMYFQEMIDDQRIDLDLFSLHFGLFSDAIRRQIRIELPGVSQIFNYSAIAEEGGAFVFEGTPLRIKVAGDRRLDVSWLADPVDADAAAEAAAPPVKGYGGRASFVVLSADPREAIRVEKLRIQKLLESFVDATGGSWSFAGGRLSMSKSGRFTWSFVSKATAVDAVDGGEALPAGFLPAGAGATGDVIFRLHIAPALAGAWDGAFSLRFDPRPDEAADEAPRADYLYRKGDVWIALVPARLGEGESGTGGAPGIVVAGPDPRFEPIVLDTAK